MKNVFVLLLLSLMFSACTTIERVDPNVADDEEVTVAWDIKDINIIARKMIGSLSFHHLAKTYPPKVILVMHVKNKTYEHIDTKAITETIMTQLLKDGKFKAIAERERAGEILEDEDFSRDINSKSGKSVGGGELYEPQKGTNSPSIVSPDLIMYGELSGIEKRDSNTTDVSYKFTLKLVDSKTQLVEWQEQKDIRKREKGGLFGS